MERGVKGRGRERRRVRERDYGTKWRVEEGTEKWELGEEESRGCGVGGEREEPEEVEEVAIGKMEEGLEGEGEGGRRGGGGIRGQHAKYHSGVQTRIHKQMIYTRHMTESVYGQLHIITHVTRHEYQTRCTALYSAHHNSLS